MRYQTEDAVASEPVYAQTEGLHFMLNFTVSLALVIGCVLLWLSFKGRVMWLKVWSAGLILASIAYLAAALLGMTGRA